MFSLFHPAQSRQLTTTVLLSSGVSITRHTLCQAGMRQVPWSNEEYPIAAEALKRRHYLCLSFYKSATSCTALRCTLGTRGRPRRLRLPSTGENIDAAFIYYLFRHDLYWAGLSGWYQGNAKWIQLPCFLLIIRFPSSAQGLERALVPLYLSPFKPHAVPDGDECRDFRSDE